MSQELLFRGRIVDVVAGRIFAGEFTIQNGRIHGLREVADAAGGPFYLPGLVDAHVHIESSLLTPVEFARAAVVHGTVATVSDPHEIANVLGVEGVQWMLDNAEQTPLKIFFGAPSCVPATGFETAGARFGPEEVDLLLADERIRYLSEVMNFPGVINGDPTMLAIIEKAKLRGKRVDGHAPGVVGEALRTYANRGIETDHECVTLEEARQRVACGMKVAIREGSAARNFDALWPLLKESPEACFFCSDDKHPDDLVESHINALLARAVAEGVEPLAAIRAATLNPTKHYGLPVGLLQAGDAADFIEVRDLTSFEVQRTFIEGQLVAENGRTLLPSVNCTAPNRFATTALSIQDLRIPASAAPVPVIVARDGQLITGREDLVPSAQGNESVADVSRDLLKIVVYNRYAKQPPALGFVRNFGLKTGAMASSVAHDSHNIVAVGADDSQLAEAINAVVEAGGGLAFSSPQARQVYPLPVAGLMGLGDAWQAADAFQQLTALARADGCQLGSPYMTLSFMALLVIPSLKMSDRGLFDGDSFSFVAINNA